MTRTVAVTNQKGGSGKTTTAVNLAAAIGETGRQVLLVDLDPQASASAWLGHPAAARTVAELFDADRPAPLAAVLQPTTAPGVTLAPSGPALARVERTGGADATALPALRAALDGLEPGRFDVVLVDCPPAVAFLTPAALVACRELVVPVEARAMALQGLAALVQTVERVRGLNPALAITGVLACRVDARTNLARDVLEALRQRFGALVFATVIRESVRLAEAPSHAQPITVYAPTSPGAEDYRAAAAELVARAPAPRPAAHV